MNHPRSRAAFASVLLAILVDGCRDADTATAVPPSRAQADGLIGRARADLARNDWQHAIDSIIAVQQIDPDHPDLPAVRAELQKQVDRASETAAREREEHAYSLAYSKARSELDFTRRELARPVVASHHLKLAQEAADQAVKLRPNDEAIKPILTEIADLRRQLETADRSKSK
jgi:hypothetical protein